MTYNINDEVVRYLDEQNIPVKEIEPLKNIKFENPIDFQSALKEKTQLNDDQIGQVINTANVQKFIIDQNIFNSKIDTEWLGAEQTKALEMLIGQEYDYKYQLENELASHSNDLKLKEKTKANKLYNKNINQKIDYIANKFKIDN